MVAEGEVAPATGWRWSTPGHGVTVSVMFRALTTEPALLPRLLEVEGLVAETRLRAERYVASGH